MQNNQSIMQISENKDGSAKVLFRIRKAEMTDVDEIMAVMHEAKNDKEHPDWFVSDDEVSAVVEFLADKNPGVQYNQQIEQQVNSPVTTGMSGDERDIHFEEAGKFIIEKEKASIGMLQRMFKIGFNRAARIMDQLCDAGVVGPEEGTKPRKVLMSMEEFQNYLENQ